MEDDAPLSPDPGQDHHDGHHRTNGRVSLYRVESNMSRSSIFEDVEMAHEEVRKLVQLATIL